jgi:hypothetical protein
MQGYVKSRAGQEYVFIVEAYLPQGSLCGLTQVVVRVHVCGHE